MSESVKTHYAKAIGPSGWSQRERALGELWRHIRESIRAFDLDEQHVRIYQDGLPVCGFEEKIVRELAEAGSCNHQLIMELIERGATLEGTEDPRLLMEEYQMQKQNIQGQAFEDAAREEQGREAERLLKARDAYIATRIDATLKPGEVGLVFLGASHRLGALSSTDIQVSALG